MAEVKHGLSRYTHHGCRCSVCRAAMTTYKRDQRAKSAKVHRLPERLQPAPRQDTAPNVVAMPAVQQPVSADIGLNEQSVRAECAQATNRELRQSVEAQAITLAKILDNPELMSMWPTTSRQLQGLMRELQSPRRKMKASHLSTVSKMAGRHAL